MHPNSRKHGRKRGMLLAKYCNVNNIFNGDINRSIRKENSILKLHRRDYRSLFPHPDIEEFKDVK